MKIEYLPNINPDRPEDGVFRIFDFDIMETVKFLEIMKKLALAKITDMDFAMLPFIEPMGTCHLVFKTGADDHGVFQISENEF